MKYLYSLLLLINVAHAATYDVSVNDNNFLPSSVTIQAGDTVRWENFGFNNHNVATQNSFEFTFRCANGCDDNGGDGDPAAAGWVSEVTFHNPSSNIAYVCEPHETIMTGSVSVQTPEIGEHIIIDLNQGFQPQQTTIYSGQRVLFENGGGEHNIKADDDRFQCADGCRDDGMEGFEFPTGQPWQIYMQFNQIGTIDYHCENPDHDETGTIHVVSEPTIFANGFE